MPYLTQRIEAVHLIEQLHQCALDFSVSRRTFTKSAPT